MLEEQDFKRIAEEVALVIEHNVNPQFEELRADIGMLKSDVGTLKSDVSTLKYDVAYLKNNMVTKDYLDDKISDLRSDLTNLVYQEDNRVSALTDTLHHRKLLSDHEHKNNMQLSPFHQAS